MLRREAREAAMKALYAHEIGRVAPQRALADVLAESSLPEGAREFARRLVAGVVEHLDELDEAIDRHSVGWSLDRLATVDRNILRVALYEIFYVADIPPSVSINEAVEIAKRYGDDDSPRFINGVLGAVLRGRSEK